MLQLDDIPDDLYKVSLRDYVCYVTVEEARLIEDQLARGAEILHFMDVVGSHTVLPTKDFFGMWHTNEEIRRLGIALDEKIRNENAKPWE